MIHAHGPYRVGMQPDQGQREACVRDGDVLLFAAAPELLSATEAWIAAMDRWIETGDPCTPEEAKSIYEAEGAAVAKARGAA